MATYNTVKPLTKSSIRRTPRALRTTTVVSGGGGGAVVPTTGQIWPRGNKGG